jgi:hypothetical protein
MIVYLLVFHAYINETHGSRSKIHSTKSRLYTYDVKFLTLLGAPYIYDISRLRVNLAQCGVTYSLFLRFLYFSLPLMSIYFYFFPVFPLLHPKLSCTCRFLHIPRPFILTAPHAAWLPASSPSRSKPIVQQYVPQKPITAHFIPYITEYPSFHGILVGVFDPGNGPDILSRNFRKNLPIYTALNQRRMKISRDHLSEQCNEFLYMKNVKHKTSWRNAWFLASATS